MQNPFTILAAEESEAETNKFIKGAEELQSKNRSQHGRRRKKRMEARAAKSAKKDTVATEAERTFVPATSVLIDDSDDGEPVPPKSAFRTPRPPSASATATATRRIHSKHQHGRQRFDVRDESRFTWRPESLCVTDEAFPRLS
jgi:hypothetical protein